MRRLNTLARSPFSMRMIYEEFLRIAQSCCIHVSSWRPNTLQIAMRHHQFEHGIPHSLNHIKVKIICGFWEFVKIQLLFIIICIFNYNFHFTFSYTTHIRQDHKLLRERCRNLDEKNMKLRVFPLDLNFICFSF